MKIKGNSVFLRETNRINMNILAMARASLDKEWVCEAARAPYSRVYMIQAGEGVITYHGKTVRLLPGNIYIIPAELDFAYSCDNYLEKLYFHVNILRYNQYDLMAECKECIVLSNRQEDITYAAREWEKQDVFGAFMMKSLLYRIMEEALVKANVSLGGIEDYSDAVRQTIHFVDENLRATLQAKDIAEQLYVSAGVLQKRFRKEVGVSLGKYIDDRLMFKAEQMLHTKGASVKDISDQLGFCDQFYFSRCFSKRYGVSPVRYRKNLIT